MATRGTWGITRNSFFHSVAENLRFRILEHGYGTVGSWWPAHQKNFPVNRLHLFFSGGGKVRDAIGTQVFKRGMVLLNPTHSDYEQIWDKPFETFYIHFRLEIYPTQDVFEGMKSARSYLLSGTDAFREIVKHSQSEGLSDSLLAEAALLSLIAPFVEGSAASIQKRLAVGKKYGELFRWMDEGLSSELDASILSKKFQLSPRTFARNFRRDTGHTPKSYIDKLLVERAQRELLFTARRVKEIAHSLGFADELYFSRFFKKQTRKSPMEYRALMSPQSKR